MAFFIICAGLIAAVVYGIKHGIDNLGNSQAKMDMNLAVSETSKETDAKKMEKMGTIDRLKFEGILMEK